MNRYALLATIGAAALVGGTALAAAAVREDRPVPLVAAGASTSVDRPSTTADAPTTTTTAAPAPEPTTTTKPAVRPTSAGPLQLRCSGDGSKSGDGGSWVYCEVKDVGDGAAFLTLSRDGETIARTDDQRSTGFKDRAVRPGATYSYQAHSFTADGRPLQRSEAIRVTVAAERQYDEPLALRCAGDGAKTGATTDAPVIHCQWKGVPAEATHVVLTRDGEPIARTDDRSVTSHADREVRPGQTYAYEVHALAADGSVIESSEAVRATAGGEQTYDGGLVMRCAGDGDGDKAGAKPYTATIHCEWKGVPERAAELVLFRDGQWFASTDDPTITHYDDDEVTPGTTYAYQLHAYAADGTLLDSSDVVRATSGRTAEGA